jgi:glutaconate CoA-transferase subunit B
LHTREELLACVVARLIGEAKHVAVGAASPIPATGALLLREKNPSLRVSFLHRRKGNPFTEGSRELFDLAGQGRIDVFFSRRCADRR